MPARPVETLYGPGSAERFVSFTPQAQRHCCRFVTVIALQWFFQMNSDGTGYLAQRTMACRNHRQARIAAVVFTVVQIVVRSLLWLAIGSRCWLFFLSMPLKTSAIP